MQRVRIGLTGLAFVFVLVLLAAVFTPANDEAPITANSICQQGRTLAPASPKPSPRSRWRSSASRPAMPIPTLAATARARAEPAR